MKKKNQLKITIILIALMLTFYSLAKFANHRNFVNAQTNTPSPTPTPPDFDQAKALAKLNEQIKGKENEPAEKVFKNIQTLRGIPAGRFLRIMEIGYARSLGVDCNYCHIPEKWEAEDKTKKQITREMAAMVGTINAQLLRNIKNLNERATINCTTCHRGQVKPALNMPMPQPNPSSLK